MRISTSNITNMATGATGSANSVYSKILQKISSGKNFTKVSENVVDATKLVKINDQLAKLQEYQSNISTATSEMDLAYDVLNDVNDKITSISSLVVEASNVTTTTDSARAIAIDIQGKVDSIVGLMNTKYLDNYIFSGTNTKTAAYFQDDDGNVVYNGANQEAGDRLLTISEGTTFAYNVSGDEIFATDADGKNFFSEMKELQELLNAPDLDYNAIREKLNVLEKAQKNVVNTTGMISTKVNKLEATQSINEDTLANLTEKKADIEELDLTQAAIDLSNAQNALQASYAISSVVLQGISLLDYL